MENISWHKQTVDEPLFPDLIWNRPENKLHAGKLLIIGGNLHGFNAPAEAFAAATKAGAGTCRVILPDVLSRTIGKLFPEAEYASSTPSGSFATKSLAELLDAAAWADAVLLAGNFGKNSETAVMIESFMQKYTGQLAMCGDSMDYLLQNPILLERPDTTLVLEFAQAQKIFTSAKTTQALTADTDLMHIVGLLQEITAKWNANIMFHNKNIVLVASNGLVSTTQIESVGTNTIAAQASVWWLQNPSKPFDALTSSLIIK